MSVSDGFNMWIGKALAELAFGLRGGRCDQEQEREVRNKYPGPCRDCSKNVPKGAGHPHREAGRWKVRCLECVDKGRLGRWLIEDAIRDADIKG